ncbi:RING/U-box superfamily protein [Euphorbia peplus]|nr:RING/U-box superfamily protein [Euphorbia peplus]
MPILLFGLVLFGILGIAFTIYAVVMMGPFSCLRGLADPGSNILAEQQKNSVSLNFSPYPSSTFKYKKDTDENIERPSETECVVCLSEFEDEEYVRQLSICRHSFHAPCIDMWLYSHSDCPLCRTAIHRLDSDAAASTSELATRRNSMDGRLDIRISSRSFSSV